MKERPLLPLERFFNDQMEDALRMLHEDDAYWSGYAFGLLGFYGGERIQVSRWHESLLLVGNDTLIARGYRAGVRAMTDAAGGRLPYEAAATVSEPEVPVS